MPDPTHSDKPIVSAPRRTCKLASRRRAPSVRRAPLASFHSLALEPAMDAAKLEQLIAADERRQSREAGRAFAVDFAGMAGELPVIGERGEIRFGDQAVATYALWEDLNEAIRPVLQRWGLALTFAVESQGEVRHLVASLRTPAVHEHDPAARYRRGSQSPLGDWLGGVLCQALYGNGPAQRHLPRRG